MRNAFIKSLIELAEKDKRVYLLTADLGFMVVEEFQKKFPDRFINVGVAEQNMIGIATGLAAEGKTPWCYSISTFATMRGLEQIRHAAAQSFPIRVIGVGGGFAYGSAGFTHWGLEDVALMSCLPNMRVVAPASPSSIPGFMKEIQGVPGPAYLRLGKGGEPELPTFLHGVPTDILVVGMGTIADKALTVAQKIGADYSEATWIRPLLRLPVLENYRKIITIEEHFLDGGLFSSVCKKVMLECFQRPHVIPFAVRELKLGKTGSREWCLDQHGLTAEKIIKALK